MSEARIVFTGLAELRDQLRHLPEELTEQASGIVNAAANTVYAELLAAYPIRTTGLHPGPHRKSRYFPPGNLRKGVLITAKASKTSVGVVVKSTAPHAWLFENGSQARHNDLGVNRGAMPPMHALIPRAMRARKTMYEQLAALMRDHGLTVTGSANG